MSRSLSLGSGFREDIRHGFRQFRRNPAFTAAVVLSLALGIGANSALFSLVHAAMLRSLPISDPGRLVAFQYTEPTGELPPALQHTHSGRSGRDSAGRGTGLSISWPAFTYLQAGVTSCSALVGFVPLGLFDKPTAIVDGEPMFVDGEMVTAGYFPALGVSPILGRGFLPDDEKPDAPRVGVISHAFWTRAFARRPTALNTTLMLNGVPVTIVGVAPSGFTGLETGRSPDLWIQMGPQPGLVPWGGRVEGAPQAAFTAPDRWWLQVAARLAPGATAEQARVELERLFQESLRLAAGEALPADRLMSVTLVPAARAFNLVSRRYLTPLPMVGRGSASPLSILMVVVGLVLLIACANVATLLLARATARRKEMSVRLALGASRLRLVRLLLTEASLYAAAGACAGLVFAAWGSRTLLALLTLGRDPLPLDLRLDPAVFGFTVAVSLVTTVLFGLAPALKATRLDLAIDLKENAATGSGKARTGRLIGGRLLVAAQVAMSLPLVIGAGLFLRTIDNLLHERLGFNPDRLLVFTVDPTKAGFKDARLLNAYGEILERLRALPGVRAASASRLALITGWVNNGSIAVEGAPPGGDPRKQTAHFNQVSPGFLATMGMPLILGRDIDSRDVAEGPQVAVVNETLARQFFAGQNPIGRRFYFGRTAGSGKPVEIVGVVADAKYATLRAPAPPTAFVPYPQSRNPLSAMAFEVRTAGDPMALVGSVRQVVRQVVPGVPISSVKTQARQMDDSLGEEALYARLFGFFGAMGVLLAAIGLHGTTAYALAQRTREIGIRTALGATRGRVIREALVEAAVVALAGLVAGGFLAWAGARFIRKLLFGVTPADFPTVSLAVLLMFTIVIVAAYVPARRAARLDPLRALREE